MVDVFPSVTDLRVRQPPPIGNVCNFQISGYELNYSDDTIQYRNWVTKEMERKPSKIQFSTTTGICPREGGEGDKNKEEGEYRGNQKNKTKQNMEPERKPGIVV